MDLTQKREEPHPITGPAPSLQDHLWAIVLAGGDGTRLEGITRDESDGHAPKQFCRFGEREPMVHWAVHRAKRLVPQERLTAVVAERHRRWWRVQLADLRRENLHAQPCNRGTAPGVLFPLLQILRRDPAADIVLLPSDHYVADEARLHQSALRAIEEVRRDPRRLVLLGMSPRGDDHEFGWIVPAGPCDLAQKVAAFVEKPGRDDARRLMYRGALLNSLILFGNGRTLLHLFTLRLPDLVGEFVSWRDRSDGRPESLNDLYRRIPTSDFSRAVLQCCADELSVVRVPECGWSDLGTPERLRAFRRRFALSRRREQFGETGHASRRSIQA